MGKMKKQFFDIQEALSLTGKTLPEEGGDEEMSDNRRSAFRVIVVDYKTGKIVLDETVIEKDESMATMKAMTMAVNPIDLDRVDIGCTVVIADFVRPKKETQKVVIEKEEKEEVVA